MGIGIGERERMGMDVKEGKVERVWECGSWTE